MQVEPTEPQVEVKKSRVVKAFAITPEIKNALMAYLGQQRHNDVAGLINSLSSSPLIDVTIVDGEAA